MNFNSAFGEVREGVFSSFRGGIVAVEHHVDSVDARLFDDRGQLERAFRTRAKRSGLFDAGVKECGVISS